MASFLETFLSLVDEPARMDLAQIRFQDSFDREILQYLSEDHWIADASSPPSVDDLSSRVQRMDIKTPKQIVTTNVISSFEIFILHDDDEKTQQIIL